MAYWRSACPTMRLMEDGLYDLAQLESPLASNPAIYRHRLVPQNLLTRPVTLSDLRKFQSIRHENVNQAKDMINQGLKLDPTRWQLHQMLGDIAHMSSNGNAMKIHYRLAWANSGGAASRMSYINRFEVLHDITGEQKELELLLQDDPVNIHAMLSLCM